jgi:hypothetical protein
MRPMRELGTPLTIGSFAIMATTGSLMFFHRAMALNGLLHRWVGLIMIGAVVLHAIVNWAAIERYAKRSNIARIVVAACAIALVGSFVNWWGYPGKSEGNVYRAVMSAPIAQVAALIGQPTGEVERELSGIGVRVASANETLDQATNSDLGLQDKIVALLFHPTH